MLKKPRILLKKTKLDPAWVSKCGCCGNVKTVDTSKFRCGLNEQLMKLLEILKKIIHPYTLKRSFPPWTQNILLTFFPRSGLAAKSNTNTVSDDVSIAINRAFMTAPTRKLTMPISLPGTDFGWRSPYLGK